MWRILAVCALLMFTGLDAQYNVHEHRFVDGSLLSGVSATSDVPHVTWLITSDRWARVFSCSDPLCGGTASKVQLDDCSGGSGCASPSLAIILGRDGDNFMPMCYINNGKAVFASLNRTWGVWVAPTALAPTLVQRVSVALHPIQGHVFMALFGDTGTVTIYMCVDVTCDTGFQFMATSAVAGAPIGPGTQLFALETFDRYYLGVSPQPAFCTDYPCSAHPEQFPFPEIQNRTGGGIAFASHQSQVVSFARPGVLLDSIEIGHCLSANVCPVLTFSESTGDFPSVHLQEGSRSVVADWNSDKMQFVVYDCNNSPCQSEAEMMVTPTILNITEPVLMTSVAALSEVTFSGGAVGFAITSRSILILFNVTIPPPVVPQSSESIGVTSNDRVNLLGGAGVIPGVVINATGFLAILGGPLEVNLTSASNVTVNVMNYETHYGSFDEINVNFPSAPASCFSHSATPQYAPQSLSVTVSLFPTPCAPTGAQNTPTSLSPTSNAPTSRAPTSLAPTLIAGIPTSFAPTSQTPTSNAPTSRAPTSPAFTPAPPSASELPWWATLAIALGALAAGGILTLIIVKYMLAKNHAYTQDAKKRIKANDMHDLARERRRFAQTNV